MLYRELCEAVGAGNAGENPGYKLVYSSDASCCSGEAVVVARPKSAEEVQRIISIARRHKVPVFPRGGGTGLCGGSVPLKGIVLDLSRMGSFSVSKGSCFCGPGVILSDLNAALSSSGLWFPVVPSSHRVCTIGGMLSTNAAGSRALKYGRAADWVEGLEVVDGKGAFFRTERIGDFCGKEGTTGIIVGAKLRLSKMPEETTMDLFKFKSFAEAISRSDSLQSEKDVSSIELACRKTSSFIGLGNFYCLFVEYENNNGQISNDVEMKELWDVRESAYPALASSGFPRIEDPAIPKEKMMRFLGWLDSRQIPYFGHPGIGVIHPCFPASRSPAAMYRKVFSLGGRVTGEHGIGLLKKRYASREFISEVMALKQRYDPDNILNRGKLYG